MILPILLSIASTSWAIQPLPVRPIQRPPEGYERWADEFARRIQSNFMQAASDVQRKDLTLGGIIYGDLGVGGIQPAYRLDVTSGAINNAGTDASIIIDPSAGTPTITLKRDGATRGTVLADTEYLYIDGVSGVRIRDDSETIRIEVGSSGTRIGASGTPISIISTGTYTPTLTNGANVDSSSVDGTFRFVRIGSFVQVFGTIIVNTTAASTLSNVGISLPVASNFSAGTDALGVAVSPLDPTGFGRYVADTTNDRLDVYLTPTGTGNVYYTVQGFYTII